MTTQTGTPIIFFTDTLPNHYIAQAAVYGGLYMYPAVPNGWKLRKPYNGPTTSLQRVSPSSALAAIKLHGGAFSPATLISDPGIEAE